MSKLKTISCIMVFTLANGAAASCDVEFTEPQLDTMTRAYVTGKPMDLGYTLAAISWRESRAGQDVVRMGKSIKMANIGAFQNQVYSTGNREGCKTKSCYANVAYRLLTDQKYASKAALKEVNYWMNVHNGNIRKALASYNSGVSHNSKSKSYAANVVVKAKYLQKCVSFAGRPVVNKPDPSVMASNSKTINKLNRIR